MLKRKELVERFAELGYTKKAANIILSDLTKILIAALVNGEEVMLHGFGVFCVKTMRARASVNIKTQERFVIPGHKVVKFIPGNQLKRCIKEGIIRE